MSDERKVVFVDGFRTFDKREKAPDFVLGTLLITLDDFYAFCKANPEYLSEYNGKKQIRLDIKMGRDNRVNFSVDTFKPNTTKSESGEAEQVKSELPF